MMTAVVARFGNGGETKLGARRENGERGEVCELTVVAEEGRRGLGRCVARESTARLCDGGQGRR